MKKIVPLFLIIIIVMTGCGKTEFISTKDNVQVTPTPTPTPIPSVEQEDKPTPYPTPGPMPSTATILMVGDILLHTPVERSALREDGTYDYSVIFANCRDEIEAADLSIVNEEVIIGGKDLGVSGYPAFNAPYEIGDELCEVGFDVICHGTNHALDKGSKGLINCLSFWKENHPEIGVVGINASEKDAQSIYVTEVNGIKIAILNYTYSTNGIALPEDMPYAVNMLTEKNKAKIISDIACAEAEADFTIVCPHWGTEYSLDISSEQRKWNELFLENGVDLVLGTHPHVIEPIEEYYDGGELSMLTYYSLGNFVNWTSGTGEGVANRMVGGMSEVTISYLEGMGEAEIVDYDIVPLICHVEAGMDGVTVYKMRDYTKELADQNAIRAQDPSFSYDYCLSLVDTIWGDAIAK